MDSLAQFQACMATLGPLVDSIEDITQGPDGDEWRVELADASVVEIEFDEARQRIALSAHLGAPQAEHRAHTCEILLSFNLLWQDALPVRMAIGSPGEQAVLVAELAASAVDLREFPLHLSGFVALAARWRQHVSHGCQAVDEPSLRTEPGAFRV